MARVSKIGELEARKLALVTESEICRESLKAELENLRAHGAGFIRNLDRGLSLAPWLMVAGPLAAPIFGRFFRKRAPEVTGPAPVKGAIGTAMLAFRLYRQYSPLIKSAFARFRGRHRSAASGRRPANHA